MGHILDTSCLKIYISNKYINYDFNFLNILKEYFDINQFYNILNHLEDQNLKNIYNHIYFRWNKISSKHEMNNDLTFNRYLNRSEFDMILEKFINNELYKAISVVNLITSYLYH